MVDNSQIFFDIVYHVSAKKHSSNSGETVMLSQRVTHKDQNLRVMTDGSEQVLPDSTFNKE